VLQRSEVAREIGDGDTSEARLDASDAERDVRGGQRVLPDDERARATVEEGAESAPLLLPDGWSQRGERGAQGDASFTQ
jgi:hypothetical protein